MKLLLLGATGRVGRHILDYALKDGHEITILVRSADKLPHLTDENVRVLTGNVLDQKHVASAMGGVDAVISALGTDKATTLSEGTPHIIEAMKREGVSRIITVGTAGILQSRVSPDLLRYQSSESRQKLTRAAEEHHKAYSLLEQSELDWTIVCPTYLPDGEYTGTYRVEAHQLPVEGMQISVPDTAEFTYQQLSTSEYIRARVGIAY
ncbi:NAD(P)-dependent oxidoreductase [Brevibacillus sp. BC25]|uniref:NAD(P)-dependent oxidoreductase n=1 Tax=Brevibacillus sp. BC25 TaxID=1144308 RepID=UPI000270E55D|nr:SDR family oxidoreductase [Brevibacillus sp. BC25]EJL29068.1 putative NADH-flavin reductase [Brevibacillus sp. BC25]